jgi:hypothetical protein
MAYTGHEGKSPRIPDLHTGLKTAFSFMICHTLGKGIHSKGRYAKSRNRPDFVNKKKADDPKKI